MSQAQLEKKVTDYLRKSQALEDYWQRPITGEQLQAEMDRMAKHTKQPEVLRELFDALGNDPFVIAECLARSALADRLLTNWYAYDQRIHGELKQRAEAELLAHPSIEQMKQLSGTYTETELAKGDSAEEQLAGGAPALQRQESGNSIKLNSREWDQRLQKLVQTFNDTAVAAAPKAFGTSKGDGLEQIRTGVLTPLQEDETRYYATAILSKTNDHLKLATVLWVKEPLDSWLSRAEDQLPKGMKAPTSSYALPKIQDGAGCTDNTWTATAADAPTARVQHTAVWTGSEMIVWGGHNQGSALNTGDRYEPATDSWTSISTTNVPQARSGHTAIWTGTEMIVWAGYGFSGFLNTGGRYNPGNDSWTATSTTNAPAARYLHIAVWTGSEMIIWGGINSTPYPNTGGRYNPNTNAWTATSTTNAPVGRAQHTGIWSGSAMIVWGGQNENGYLNTGGRYRPSTNSWTATTTTNAPGARYSHTAVWSGGR